MYIRVCICVVVYCACVIDELCLTHETKFKYTEIYGLLHLYMYCVVRASWSVRLVVSPQSRGSARPSRVGPGREREASQVGIDGWLADLASWSRSRLSEWERWQVVVDAEGRSEGLVVRPGLASSSKTTQVSEKWTISLSLYNTLLCSVVSTRRAQGCYEELAREKG